MTGRNVLRLALSLVTVAALFEAVRSFAPDAAAGSRLVAAHLGVGGFIAYLGYSLAVFVVCGAAWWVTAGTPWRRLGLFVWGRLVREATADLLPFSQVGGVVIGAAVVTAGGVPTAKVYASFVVDLLTELASQLLFTAFGIALLLRASDAQAARALPIAAIVAAMTATTLLVAALIAAPMTLSAVQRVVDRIVPVAARLVAEVTENLRTIYVDPRRLTAAFAFNLVAWFASASGACLLLHLLGAEVPVGRVIGLESLIFLLRSAAFAIPAGIGVQEAGYALLGPLVGLPADVVFAVALIKRARDLGIAIPVLLAWQIRALFGGSASPTRFPRFPRSPRLL